MNPNTPYRYKKLGSNDNMTLHQSVLDYALEQELLQGSQVKQDPAPVYAELCIGAEATEGSQVHQDPAAVCAGL